MEKEMVQFKRKLLKYMWCTEEKMKRMQAEIDALKRENQRLAGLQD